MTECRFTRTAPIPLPERLIHYCAKDNVRRFFDVCRARECSHLRPLRPPDEGSCTFRPKKQKEAEKLTAKKKKDKKPAVQNQDEEEFTEGE